MGVTWINPTKITPLIASSWTDVDVSSYVPIGTTGVLLHIEFISDGLEFGARKNGSTDDRHIEHYYASHTGFSIGVDENRILELYVESITDINVYLTGYFDSCAVFYTNAINISLNTTGSWTDIDINVNDDAIGAIIEVYNTSYNVNYLYGLRKNGSTDDRYAYFLGKTTAFIGLDENEIFEGKINNVGVDFYLTGYIKSGVTFLTNATDLSLSSTGDYNDLTALPNDATGGFIECSTPTKYSYALRKNGSSEDIYRDLIKHEWIAVECDSNQLIEGKIANTAVDFFLTGYTTVFSQIITPTGITNITTFGTPTIYINYIFPKGIESTVSFGNINIANVFPTLYKCVTQITNRHISTDTTDRNISIFAKQRRIGIEIEVTE